MAKRELAVASLAASHSQFTTREGTWVLGVPPKDQGYDKGSDQGA